MQEVASETDAVILNALVEKLKRTSKATSRVAILKLG